MDKKYSPEEKKAIITYEIELGVFSLVFIVIGVLQLTNVIKLSDRFLEVFKWLTTFGGTLIIVLFLLAIFNKKRKAALSLFDKATILPAGLYSLVLDILMWCGNPFVPDHRQILVGAAFVYLGLAYIAQAIYHYKFPPEGLFDENEKEENVIEGTIVEEKETDENKSQDQ